MYWVLLFGLPKVSGLITEVNEAKFTLIPKNGAIYEICSICDLCSGCGVGDWLCRMGRKESTQPRR